MSKNKTPLDNALLKYGYLNFSLDILQYCEKEKENFISREQFYFNLLKPEYNVLEIAGSSLGFKHNEKTLAIFRNEHNVTKVTRNNFYLAAKKRVLT